ncbi:MAG: ECF-type sigma factor [Pirellulaceae bacterium]
MSGSGAGSVSHWIAALKEGDAAAAQPLWQRYYRRLIALARKKLRTSRRRAADEEDVVQNAFHSFFRALEHGRFPQLGDRDSLWRLLVVITAHKALRQLAHECRAKRGGGTSAGSMEINPTETARGAAWLEIVGSEPTPDFAAQVADEYRRLLEMLGDESLRRVAVWKMEGYGNDEIASKLACSRRTVARKLDAIRILWSKEPLE